MSLTLPDLTLERRTRFEIPALEQMVELKQLRQQDTRLAARLSGESIDSKMRDRLDDLRSRLRTMNSFEEATRIGRGRQRLLLTLYLHDNGDSYLPPFDDAKCADILGDGAELRLLARLQQAAQLYFKHFDRLQGHAALGRLLHTTLRRPESASLRATHALAWREHCERLFATNGPDLFVSNMRKDEGLLSAAERCGVLHPSRFLDLARQKLLFVRLLELRMGDDDSVLFRELTAQASQKLSEGELIGVKALQIMVRRCIHENSGQLPPRWGERIAEFACDPRLPRRSPEFGKWWQWANDQERSVALSWFTGRDLETFLAVLESSLDGEGARMFPRRSDFLRKLYRAGKIREARLVLTRQAFNDVVHALPGRTHGAIARMRSNDGISVVCIRCDDFSFVEGTHSFAIQLFKELPIRGFWEKVDLSTDGSRSVRRFEASDFRTDRLEAIRHVDSQWQHWEGKFIDAVARCFHVAWQGWRHW